jgi:hypothetical protein
MTCRESEQLMVQPHLMHLLDLRQNLICDVLTLRESQTQIVEHGEQLNRAMQDRPFLG